MPSEIARQAQDVTLAGMTKEQYFAAPGLSQSAIKDLMVSPLRFWYRHVDPNRIPEEPTPEMIFGNAVHCAVLEPEEFGKRYARKVDVEDFNGCLVTVPEMRAYMKEHNQPLKGTLKEDIIRQVLAFTPNVPILDVELAKAEAANVGKAVLAREDFDRVLGCCTALHEEPRFTELIKCGIVEQPLFAVDPDTGAAIRGRPDFTTPKVTVDLKTFVAKRGKSIDRSTTDAVLYEGYHHQAYFYYLLRSQQPEGLPPDWRHVIAFVESVPPHEVRLRSIQPKWGGEPSLLWMRALLEVRSALRMYQQCSGRFGVQPWRTELDIDPVLDEEIPALAYS